MSNRVKACFEDIQPNKWFILVQANLELGELTRSVKCIAVTEESANFVIFGGSHFGGHGGSTSASLSDLRAGKHALYIETDSDERDKRVRQCIDRLRSEHGELNQLLISLESAVD